VPAEPARGRTATLLRRRAAAPEDQSLARAAAPAREEDMPRAHFTKRQLAVGALFVLSALAFLYFALPRLVGFGATWNRIRHGNAWWLALAAVFEICSFAGYIALFRAVFVRGRESRIGWGASYQITMAGVAATRLFASAGAGGIALTAWALRRSGMDARVAACRMVAFMALLYGAYMVTLVVDGLGLYLGVIPGEAPFAITIVPAIFGAVVIALFLGVSLLPGDVDRLVARWSHRGRVGRALGRLAALPATAATGVRTALGLLRERRPSLLGAAAWWAFDIATLWASFHAFGASPPKGVIVMAYFVGMLGNTLPLPGGIGGVDGGMIGAFSAFGIDVEVSIVSVLAYRAFAFWLPTLPGAIAYLQLRRTVQRWQAEPAGV
jgi:uncharacterized membrane protein YbhN (UPF0104 family)